MSTTKTESPGGAIPQRPGGPDIRVSDADRDAAIAELADHFQAGRLDQSEFEERMDRAVRARTRRDLDQPLADLPSAQPKAAPAPAAQARSRVPVPLLAAIAIVASVALVAIFGGGAGGRPGDWAPWWIIPVAFLFLRGWWWRRARFTGRWR